MIFRNRLQKESQKWVDKEIISPDQRDAITSLYKHPRRPVNFSAILIAFAVLLIGTGLILFYGANWKSMAPWLKLIQIFLLILTSYGIFYYRYFVNGITDLLSRAFLMIGFITFGAGIMLVAQVYHISSHPTNGIVAWGAGVFAMALLLREKWGIFLSLLLFTIWNYWEVVVFDNINYLFGLVILAHATALFREKEKKGLVISLLLLIAYLLQIEIFFITSHFSWNKMPAAVMVAAFLQVPLGGIIYSLGRMFREDPFLAPLSKTAMAIGWLFIMIPLLGISWPISFKTSRFLFIENTANLSYMLIGATLLGGITTWLIYRKKKPFILPGAAFITGTLFIILPMGDKPVLMTFSHLALVTFTGIFLYRALMERSRLSHFFALAGFSIILFFKVTGFSAFGQQYDSFMVAYMTGSVLLVVLFYVLHQVIVILSKNREYKGNFIRFITALAGGINLYILSFKMPEQQSFFDAQWYIILLAIIFILLSTAGFVYLARFSEDKLPVFLPGGVFLISVLVLFSAGPWFSWIVYSLVFNFLLLAYSLLLIFYSSKIKSRFLANSAIALFVIHVITRYFDLFWDMLSGSLLFIVTGILFLAGGWFLERNRRILIKKIKTEGADDE